MSQSPASAQPAFCWSCGFWGRSGGKQGLSGELRLRSQVPCMEKGENVVKGISPFDIKVTGPLVEEPGERGFEPTWGRRASLTRSLVLARVVQAMEGNSTQRKKENLLNVTHRCLAWQNIEGNVRKSSFILPESCNLESVEREQGKRSCGSEKEAAGKVEVMRAPPPCSSC